MEDIVFQEEEQHLDQVERKIQKSISSTSYEIERMNREINSYHPVDYEDIGRKKLMINERAALAKDLESFDRFISSPYFGRLDLDDGNKERSYYIGNRSFSVGGKDIIIDWRTPVGNFIHVKNQKTLHVEGITYSLTLRRRLFIRNAVLESYNTEYEADDTTLKGDVIDPFLITVLKDKRRQRRLTDIIRTIQSNQNDIIRRPIYDSFIVQGCAGSGKTMILLHRLSYLKFNNPDMSLNGVKIITPNQDFNTHINELSTELEIDQIRKMTVEEYYVDLIHRYTGELNVRPEVRSESRLASDLLAEIYSADFTNLLSQEYHKHWDTVLQNIQEDRLHTIYRQKLVKYPATEKHNAMAAQILGSGIKKIVDDAKKERTEYNDAVKRKATAEEELTTANSLLDNLVKEADAVRDHTTEALKAESARISEQIEDLRISSQPDRESYDALTELDRKAAEGNQQAKEALSKLRFSYQNYTDYDQFMALQKTTHNETMDIITRETADITQKIGSLNDQIANLPNYGFVKRNALKKELEAAKQEFTRTTKNCLDTIIDKKEKELAEFQGPTEEERAQLEQLKIKLKEVGTNLANLLVIQGCLDECVTLLSSHESHHMPVLSPKTETIAEPYLKDYERITDSIDKQNAEIARIHKRINAAEERIKQYQDSDLPYLEKCKKEIERLEPEKICKEVIFRNLAAAYQKHGEEYTDTPYRHKLYLTLYLCTLYYDRNIAPDTFLNIDEAQDISVAEYLLIRKILGDRCIFNLYGDINQTIFPEKGITDWSDLRGIINDQVFVLNEDYRNTQQITDFCNNEFGAEIYPIGISGDNVLRMKPDQVFSRLANMKKQNPDYRIAIILKSAQPDLDNAIRSHFDEKNISWYSVDDRKISILTVENAKGLEFEAVAVIPKGMEINEQYIAYTRALDHLHIVT